VKHSKIYMVFLPNPPAADFIATICCVLVLPTSAFCRDVGKWESQCTESLLGNQFKKYVFSRISLISARNIKKGKELRMEFDNWKKLLIGGSLIIILSIVFASCSSTKQKPILTPEARLKHAIELFNKKHYLDAKTELTIIVLNYPGSSVVDKAQYYLAESHFKLKEYILAAAEYQKLLRNYPESQFADDARYKIGLCYYELSPHYGLDQEYTYKAIDEFQRFLEDYPKSSLKKDVQIKLTECRNKLAKKDYKNAELYRKMNEWKAAEIYYSFVINDYYDTPFGEEALFWKGEAEYHQDKFKEARNTLAEYLRKFPDGSYRSKAKKRLRTIRKILNKSEVGQTAQKLKSE